MSDKKEEAKAPEPATSPELTDEQKKARKEDLDNRVQIFGEKLQVALEEQEIAMSLYVSTSNNRLTAQAEFMDRKAYN